MLFEARVNRISKHPVDHGSLSVCIIVARLQKIWTIDSPDSILSSASSSRKVRRLLCGINVIQDGLILQIERRNSSSLCFNIHGGISFLTVSCLNSIISLVLMIFRDVNIIERGIQE